MLMKIDCSSAIRAALLCSVCSPAVFALGPTAALADTAVAGEIVVTGSRIPRPGLESTSPIQTVTGAAIGREQPHDIQDVLLKLPEIAAGQTSEVNNGSNGYSSVDLRGLSPPRTLVLIDGRRMVGADPNGVVDTTNIPIALLERVDVVTGGASAVYGSDAIAGVVNFILKKDFEGAQSSVSYTNSDHQGTQQDWQGTIGGNFADNRGNVALSLGYLNRKAVFQTFAPASYAKGASSTTFPSAFDTQLGGRVQPDLAGTILEPIYQKFDFNPQNYFQTPQVRYNGTAIARYQITPDIEAYSRLLFSHSDVMSQLASSGTFGAHEAIPLNNPFLSGPQSAFLTANDTVGTCASIVAGDAQLSSYGVSVPAGNCVDVGTRWRTTQLGGRQRVNNYVTYQSLFGFDGKLWGWDWDVNGAHGESVFARQQNNDMSVAKLQQALFATSTTTCFDPSNNCSPVNLFQPLTPQNAAALSFISLNLQLQSRQVQDYLQATTTGHIPGLQSPLASNPFAESFGVEYRRESAAFQPDLPSETGVSPGFGQTVPTQGAFNVYEYFGELLAPLVQNKTWVKNWTVELGGRLSQYKPSGEHFTYKFGTDFTPIDGFMIRAMYQHALRAPNTNDLYAARESGTTDVSDDPCADGPLATGGAGTLYNLCHLQGAPQAALNAGTVPGPISGQESNYNGGNIHLQPEVANTLTVGLVAQPPQVPGLNATVDYYDVDIKNAISVRPAQDIIDACLTAARNPTFAFNSSCALIQRDPISGDFNNQGFSGVDQTEVNIGNVRQTGIDASVAYSYALPGLWNRDMGELAASFSWTHLLKASYMSSPGAPVINCIGHYGKNCGYPEVISQSTGSPTPEDRIVGNLLWNVGAFEAGLRWRHLSGMTLDSGSAIQAGDHFGYLSKRIPSFDYLDVSAGWDITKNVRVNGNINNIAGRQAPYVYTSTGSTAFNSGNTYPSTYDVLGRVYTIGLVTRW